MLKKKMGFAVSCLAIACITPLTLYALFDRYSAVGKELGWIDAPNTYNICQGYYKELPIAYTPNPFALSQAKNYDIRADKVTYALKGRSTLQGNVIVKQPDQQLKADKAYLYPNKKTGKIVAVDVFGHVHLMEPGKLLLADSGRIKTKNKQVTLKHVRYRMAMDNSKTVWVLNKKTGKKEKQLYQLNGWGVAKSAKQVKPGLIYLKGATYSTCPPNASIPCWQVRASTIRLNSNTGRGAAWNDRLVVKGVPVFYFPYLNFPINHKRYTGFLIPSLGSDKRSGNILAIPFYLNLAPNYDATLTPTIMSHRGLFMDGLFRYLTPIDQGSLHVGFIPNDRVFKRFQKRAYQEYPNQPMLGRLQDYSANRFGFSFKDAASYNENFSSKIDYNYVSDDYYIQDLSNKLVDNSDNQLLRQGELNYANEHWTGLANLQYYQTLHPVNMSSVSNQYARLPEFQLNGDYPDQWFNSDLAVNTQFVRFQEKRSPTASAEPVIGNRTSVRPIISLPLMWPFAYLTPRVQFQMTKYDTHNLTVENANDRGEVIPIFDIEGGMTFVRRDTLFGHDYEQTFEPEIYYLRVPYRQQSSLPIFDTYSQSFSYDNLFNDNRFSGVDRIGDANQLAWSLKTRFIDANTGAEKASAEIGQIRYFRDRKVGLYSGNPAAAPALQPVDTRIISPLAGKLTYDFNASWSLTANGSYNSYYDDFDNKNVSIQYKPDAKHIVNLSYEESRGGDRLPGVEGNGVATNSWQNDLEQTDLTVYWNLNDHWSIMGRYNYNWSHEHEQAYFYGIEYESCCWAVRFVSARTYEGKYPDPSTRSMYDRTWYLQFALKSLGNIGKGNDLGNLLQTWISGYTDSFGSDD